MQFRVATGFLLVSTFVVGAGLALVLAYAIHLTHRDREAVRAEEVAAAAVSRELAAAKLARQQADLVLADATAMRSDSTAVLDGRVHELFAKVRKLHPGRNDVGDGYVDWFEINGDQIKVRIENKSKQAITPDFSIVLVNRLGFVTAEYSDKWIIDELDPDEAHVGEGPLWVRVGQPVYYIVKK